MKIIKRYGNRKLYSTDERHYINLARLADIIRGGEEVQVVSHVTGLDLTAQTMAQIIYEEELRGPPRVSAEVLVKIVREGISAQ